MKQNADAAVWLKSLIISSSCFSWYYIKNCWLHSELAETERKKAFQNIAIFVFSVFVRACGKGRCVAFFEVSKFLSLFFYSENMLALADFGVQFRNKQEYFYWRLPIAIKQTGGFLTVKFEKNRVSIIKGPKLYIKCAWQQVLWWNYFLMHAPQFAAAQHSHAARCNWSAFVVCARGFWGCTFNEQQCTVVGNLFHTWKLKEQ